MHALIFENHTLIIYGTLKCKRDTENPTACNNELFNRLL